MLGQRLRRLAQHQTSIGLRRSPGDRPVSGVCYLLKVLRSRNSLSHGVPDEITPLLKSTLRLMSLSRARDARLYFWDSARVQVQLFLWSGFWNYSGCLVHRGRCHQRAAFPRGRINISGWVSRLGLHGHPCIIIANLKTANPNKFTRRGKYNISYYMWKLKIKQLIYCRYKKSWR